MLKRILLFMCLVSVGSGVTNAMPLLMQQPAGDAQAIGSPTYYLDYADGYFYALTGFPNIGSGNGGTLRNPSIIQEQNSGIAANTLYTRACGSTPVTKVTNQFQVRVTPTCGLWTEGTTACTSGGCISGGNTGQTIDNTNFIWYDRDWTCAGNCVTNAPNNSWVTTTATTAKDQTSVDGVANAASSVTAVLGGGKVCQNFGIPTSNATIATAGTAYTVNDVLTTVGGTCTVQPKVKVLTAPGGVPATITFTGGSIGLCQTLPTNPVAVTGGTGTGFTANLVWQKMPQSVYIKRVTGTGTVSLSLDDTTYTDFSGSINSSTYTRASLAPITAPVTPKFCLKLGTTGDEVAVDLAQAINSDAGDVSAMLTTNGTNLLGDEMPSFNTPSGSPIMQNAGYRLIEDIYQGHPFSMLVTYSGNFSPTLSHLIIGTDGSSNTVPFATGAAGGGVITFSAPPTGSMTSTGTDVSGLGTLNKAVFSCGATHCKVCVNGVGPDINTSLHAQFNPAAANLTHAGQLNNGSGLLPSNGYERGFYGWKYEISDYQCQQYSKVGISFLQQ